MLKKSKAMKTTVAMLAAVSMVSGLVFADVTPNGADAGSFHVVDQSQNADNTTNNAANGKDPVKVGNHAATLNVIASNNGYKSGAGFTDATGKKPTNAKGQEIDATTGASILVTDDTTSLENRHNAADPNDPDKYAVDANKAKVVVTGERTEMGLATYAEPTGTATGAWGIATGAYSTAYGNTAKATGAHAAALTSNSTAAAADSIAAGWGSVVEKGADGGVAIGKGATVKADAKDGVAIGAGSVADQANTVSIGSADLQRRLTNVADGVISANSHDAVTGRQLYKTNQELDNVGALSAALAGLHPLDYTGTGSKVSVATAVGNYDGKKALAVGGFYNFSPDAMMSLGASMSFSGDKKYAENLGFTFRVGEGASTAPAGHHDEMADRFVAMEQAISELKAQNEALSQQVTAVEQENKDLKAKVGTLQK